MRTLLLGGLVGALVVSASLGGLLETAEFRALNALFELRGTRPPVTPIVIVTIDEDSFDELGLAWPWPRALHGRFLDTVSRGHPVAVGLDIVFAEPSARGPADDARLAGAVARAGNVVLAAAHTMTRNELFTKVDLKPPIPRLRAGAAGFGPVNYGIDPDSNVRRASLEYRLEGERFGSFVRHLYELGVRAGLPAKALPAGDTFMINYRGGPRTFPWVPYYRVLNGEVSPDAFAGKIVLVGATTPILHDVFSTPFAPSDGMPGIEIHANALETLFRGIPIRPAPRAVGLAASLVAAFAAAWLTRRVRPLPAFLVLSCVGLAGWALAFGLFVLWHAWAATVGPTLALVLGYGTTVVVAFVQEQREKRRLSRFFSPAVLREIVRHKHDVNLGSARRLITVLFSDIRGFTSMSERLEPEQVAEVLREYLTELTEIVFRHGGTVDKYVGDCIMALYNAPVEQPDHAAQAVRTALAFQAATQALSARWEARLGVSIRNGVGINTGEAVVGTLGSRQRLEYTAIGDTVNLAARLESLTKDFHTAIIISESTWALVNGQFPARALGEVTVKGKAVPVGIHAVLATSTRKDERVPADVLVAITAGAVTVEAAAHDLSASGVSVRELPIALAPGATVRLSIAGTGLRGPVGVDARLVWRREEVAGFAFGDLDGEAARILADYVAPRMEAARSAPVADRRTRSGPPTG